MERSGDAHPSTVSVQMVVALKRPTSLKLTSSAKVGPSVLFVKKMLVAPMDMAFHVSFWTAVPSFNSHFTLFSGPHHALNDDGDFAEG